MGEHKAHNEQIVSLGVIKDVKINNLVSGDKQATVKIIVNNPKEIEEVAKFANLPHKSLVVITHDPSLKL